MVSFRSLFGGGNGGGSEGINVGGAGAAVGAAGTAAILGASPLVIAGGLAIAGIVTAAVIAAIIVPIVIVTQTGSTSSSASSSPSKTEQIALARGTTNVQTTVPNIAFLSPTSRSLVGCFGKNHNLTKTNGEIIDFLESKPYFGNFTEDYNITYVCDRNLFLNASISFRTVSSEFVYTKQNITDIIKTIQFVNISPIPGLTYTPNKDLVVQMNGRWTEYNGTITLANDCAISLDYQDNNSEYIDELANDNCFSYIYPFEEMTTMMEETNEMDEENQQRLINENEPTFDLQSGVF